jgi:hypothetical protein
MREMNLIVAEVALTARTNRAGNFNLEILMGCCDAGNYFFFGGIVGGAGCLSI